MAYNPDNSQDRKTLATALEAMFSEAKFTKVDSSFGEDIYAFAVPQIPGVSIMVYSTIVEGYARPNGADAIRVAAVYTRRDGGVKPLTKDTRVNRTGEVDKIVARTLERMRNSYSTLRERNRSGLRCSKCGAPLFTSAKGNDVCAETCWSKQPTGRVG